MSPRREKPNFSKAALDEDDQAMKIPSFNFNTLVSAIALAVILWVGKSVYEQGTTLVEIKTSLPYMLASVGKLEAQVSQLVTRGELESLRAEVAAKNSVLDKRLMQLEFEKKKIPNEP